MNTSDRKFKNIEAYIRTFPKDVAVKLRAITKLVRSAAPEAQEGINYGMPAFKLNGALVYYAGFKNHIGFFALPSAIRVFKKKLTKYKTSKSSVQLPLDQPLPLLLLRELIAFRVKTNRAKVKKKK